MQIFSDFVDVPGKGLQALNPLEIADRYSACIGQNVRYNRYIARIEYLVCRGAGWAVRAFDHELSLDLVGIDEVAHGKRVGYMAFKCAEIIGLDKLQRERLFYIGLMHDCGVSSTRLHHRLISELQWEHDSDHAINGARLLSQSEHLNQYAPVVHFHHTPWKQLKDLEHIPDSVKFDANLIYLVDRVDTLAVTHYNRDLQEQIDPIRQQING